MLMIRKVSLNISQANTGKLRNLELLSEEAKSEHLEEIPGAGACGPCDEPRFLVTTTTKETFKWLTILKLIHLKLII